VRFLQVCLPVLAAGFYALPACRMFAQDPRQVVQQAVNAELASDREDHSRWRYHEVDRQPGNSVTQWVAETGYGDVKRVLKQNGREVPEAEQEKQVEGFIADAEARTTQQKAGQHDDQQAETMMKLLPKAFVWTETGRDASSVSLAFHPDPAYHPPSYEARVFAGMEGEMTVDLRQHRITSLKGHLVDDVKFGLGILGRLKKGGYFEVSRREVSPHHWEIDATHVHIQGHALLFKTISEEEDDMKSQFWAEPESISLQQAAAEVMAQPAE
jgi:hypothetical protein